MALLGWFIFDQLRNHQQSFPEFVLPATRQELGFQHRFNFGYKTPELCLFV